jgi:hypothetical protein
MATVIQFPMRKVRPSERAICPVELQHGSLLWPWHFAALGMQLWIEWLTFWNRCSTDGGNHNAAEASKDDRAKKQNG